MVSIIINLIIIFILVCLAVYVNRRDKTATERLNQVEQREKRLNGLYEPAFSYKYGVDFDKNRVIVGCSWDFGIHIQHACIKAFPFNPDDLEDMAFAIREAEELIDKLKEK